MVKGHGHNIAGLSSQRVEHRLAHPALRGMVGYGASSREVEKHGLRMSVDCPVVVSVIDDPVRITALAEVWSAMLPAGLITVEDVSVVLYCGDDDDCGHVAG